MHTDRQLLFGLLALQCGFISKDQLVAAFRAWTNDKQITIEDIIAEQKALTPNQLALLKQLEAEILAQHHQSVEQSLITLSSIGLLRQGLEGFADAQLNATLAYVARNVWETLAPSVESNSHEMRRQGALRYRTIRLYARGGLGEVFVAKDEELNREVALKEIQERFADHDESRARFKLEAEITGNLEHPGIVPVYGLGQYDDGRPYYAMRFIRGESLKEAIEAFHAKYKDRLIDGEAGLELRKLLRRFVDVCNAMAYAHSRGVLHRDLKPGNIILGKYGETLVVDWGLAKAQGQSESTDASIGPVAPSSGSGATPTIAGSALGTPAYMSPEQAAGKVNELNAMTDVYSLGATMFHLLTGQLPITGNSPLEMVKKAAAGEIHKPRELRGDVPKPLEAVCLKAMARDPDQRYSSPTALADEIEKWLADEPVSAYIEPFLIRVRRWVRRHPALVSTTAACVVLGLCAAMIVAYQQGEHARELAGKNVELTVAKNNAELAAKAEEIAKQDAQAKQKLAETERERAEQREQEAIDAVKRFGDAVANNKELKDNPKLESLRKELLKEPLSFFKSLRERLQADQDTRTESLVRLANAAFELGNLTNEIGDKKEAITAYKESLMTRERLAQDNPSVTDFQRDLSRSYNNLAVVFREIDRPTDAIAAFEQAKLIRERLVRENPTITEFQSALALAHVNLGVLLSDIGKTNDAFAHDEQAKTILEQLVRDDPSIAEYQSALSLVHQNQSLLFQRSGRPIEAIAAFQQAIAIRERLAMENPDVSRFKSELARSYHQLANRLRDSGKLAEAIELHEKARTIQEQLVLENPTVTLFQSELARSRNLQGFLFRDKGQLSDAIVAFEQARSILERLVLENPSVTGFRSELGGTFNNLSIIKMDLKEYTEAKRLLREAIHHQKIAMAENSKNPGYRQYLKNHFTLIQRISVELSDIKLAEEAQAGLIELASTDPQYAALDGRIAEVLGGKKAKDAAELTTFGKRAFDLRRFIQATQFFGEALEQDPTLSQDREGRFLYHAARSATLGLRGDGVSEPPLDDAAKAKLRTQILGWMKKELEQWQQFLRTDGTPAARQLVKQALAKWEQDVDLAFIRDAEKFTEIAEADRKECEDLLSRIKEMLENAQEDSQPDTK